MLTGNKLRHYLHRLTMGCMTYDVMMKGKCINALLYTYSIQLFYIIDHFITTILCLYV